MVRKIFKLPDLGEGLPDAEIVEWHAAVGKTVNLDAALLSVETDKAVVDVPSPFNGILVKVHGVAGDIIKVGAPLAEFEVDAVGADKIGDAGTVVGKMDTRSTLVNEPVGAMSKEAVEVKATPAVRALAKRMGVELSMVKPSGPDGVVTADDIKRVSGVLAELGPIEALRGVRRAMARTMSLAGEQVVPVTLVDDADIDHWPDAEDISLRLIQAVVAGCTAEPGLNAWYDHQAVGRRVLERIDLGIAVDTDDGLFVPVLGDAGRLGGDALRRQLEQIKAAVKSRDIPPENLRGSSFTLSNFGVIGGRYATPIVVPPSVAILAAGSTRDEVVADRGVPAVHKVLPLSLTFDHRCVTGGEAARFLQAVIKDLQVMA